MVVPRLFVDAALSEGGSVSLGSDQTHYLANVLRLSVGAAVRVFNGRDGEWTARVSALAKRSAALTLEARRRAQDVGPDVHLLFAPLKKTRTDFVVEKAAELGVSTLRPVFTRHTDASRVNVDRLSALAREAAEQCERLDVPRVAPAQPLAAVLDGWGETDPERRILFCDEAAGRADTPWADPAAGEAAPAALTALTLPDAATAPWAVLVGPEGGFSPEERQRLWATPGAQPVHLGPRILRADTAAVAALTLWQAAVGDWR